MRGVQHARGEGGARAPASALSMQRRNAEPDGARCAPQPQTRCVSQTDMRIATISATMPAGTAWRVREMLTDPK